MWDTAGQEKYQSLVPLYVRDSQVICVVAEYEEKQSISNIQKWIDTSKEQCETAQVFVVINKIDKAKDQLTALQEIESQMGESYENIFFVSAMDGTNIDSLFYSIAKIGYEKKLLTKKSNNLNISKEEPKNKSGCC